jgi:transcriptional regulator with XRE-family HTH domain
LIERRSIREAQTMIRDPIELIDQRVAARIRERRIDMGITLQALAQQIGVAFQQAHKYERGLSRISAGRLYHVACALKAPVGFFFARDNITARTKDDTPAGPVGLQRNTPAAIRKNGINNVA